MSKTKLSHFFIPHHKNDHRAHFLKPVAFHAVIVFLLGLQLVFSSLNTVKPGVLGVQYSITPDDIIAQTNDQRGKNGLLALRGNGQLANAAQLKGQDMLAKQYWAHTAPDGKEPWYFINQSGYRYARAGENLARDFRDSLSVVNAWMNSPGHRANVLNSNYQDIGVAVVSGPFNGYEAVIVVQMFGQPASGGVANALTQAPSVAAQVAPTPKPAIGKEIALKFEKVSSPSAANAASGSATIAQLTKPDDAQIIPIPEQVSGAPLLDPQAVLKTVVLAAGIFFAALLLVDAVVIAKQRIQRVKHGHSTLHAVFLLIIMISLLVVQGGLIL